MFREADLSLFQNRGIPLQTVETQIDHFQQGFPYLKIQKAATVGDGIIRLSDAEAKQYIEQYEQVLSQKKVVKFVPASGAASRMFKELFAALNAPEQALSDNLLTFFRQLKDFAFYQDLQ